MSPTTAVGPADPGASTTTLRPDTQVKEVAPETTETTPTLTADPQIKVPAVPAPIKPKSKLAASTSTSPRDSEESYDLVSDQGGKGAKQAAPSQDDEDSDWE